MPVKKPVKQSMKNPSAVKPMKQASGGGCKTVEGGSGGERPSYGVCVLRERGSRRGGLGENAPDMGCVMRWKGKVEGKGTFM